MLMHCRACGKVGERAAFCSRCGTPTDGDVASYAYGPPPTAKRSISVLRILGLLFLFAVGVPTCVTCGTCAAVTSSSSRERADRAAEMGEDPSSSRSAGPTTASFEGMATASLDEKDAFARAIETLREACPLLKNHWGRIVRATVEGDRLRPSTRQRGRCKEFSPEMVCRPRFKPYGWTQVVNVNLELDDREGDFITSGHTLHYWVGVGRRPGIVMNKRPERLLCGLATDSGDDIWLSIPPLNDILAGDTEPDDAAPTARHGVSVKDAGDRECLDPDQFSQWSADTRGVPLCAKRRTR